MTEQSTSRPGLEPMGWAPEFERSFALVAGPGTEPARVVARQRDRWTVWTENGPRTAVASGRLEATGEWPGVGDWVVVEGVAGSSYVLVRIVELVPRRSAFRRRAAGSGQTEQVLAANVDLALVLTALPSDLSPRRLERYVTLARDCGALPVIVLTKLDLTSDAAAAVHAAREAAPGVDVVSVSALTGAGLDGLRDRLRPRITAVLLGSSGAGKSTLLNRLLGEDRAQTNAVRDDGRGRHTTPHRELFRTSWGALIIDTPGLREVGLWADGAALDASFRKYSDDD